MKCEHTSEDGKLCKSHAVRGWNMCSNHGWKRRFYIGFTWQQNPGDHWQQRRKAVWPILFHSWREAQDHLSSVRPFQNMQAHRKLTACVENCKTRFPHPNLREVPK